MTETAYAIITAQGVIIIVQKDITAREQAVLLDVLLITMATEYVTTMAQALAWPMEETAKMVRTVRTHRTAVMDRICIHTMAEETVTTDN